MLPRKFRIAKRTQETVDTFTLELKPVEGGPNFSFSPGQFTMLYAHGVGEVPISICGDPANTKTLFHTIRAVGTVTNAINAMKIGASLGVRGPFGSTWPAAEARGKDLVIACGGIGLPPLRPLLYHVFSHRADYGRVVLLYGARTPGDMVYKGELKAWARRKDLELHVTVDKGDEGWTGNVGVVTTLIPRARFDPRNTFAVTCGPEIMMRFVMQELQKNGVPDGNIYLSMERNMKCGIGTCGHCQMGPFFVCKDGPVFRADSLLPFMSIKEL